MKLAAVKLTSTFLEYLFRRDAPDEWRPPHQYEAGFEKTATFLRAVNDDNGVTLIFGDDEDSRFFNVDEGSEVPAIDVLCMTMGNGAQVIVALQKLRARDYEDLEEQDELWGFIVEAFRLDEPPEAAFLPKVRAIDEGLEFDVAAKEEKADGT